MSYIARRIAMRNRIPKRREKYNGDAEFLFKHAANTICDKLLDLKKPLQNLLILNPRDKVLIQALKKNSKTNAIAHTTLCEPSRKLAHLLAQNIKKLPLHIQKNFSIKHEIKSQDLPFDSLLAFFALHWHMQAQVGESLANSLTNAMKAFLPLLSKDAPIYAITFGEGTLATLARVLIEAEAKFRKKVYSRIPAYPSIACAGDCLRDLPLAHPFVESNAIEVEYSTLTALFNDLQAMGESNCFGKTTTLSREILKLAEKIYPKKNGSLIAEFNLLTLHGWVPSQMGSILKAKAVK